MSAFKMQGFCCAVAAVVTGLCIAAVPAPGWAAGSAWSVEVDCATCHEAEAQTLVRPDAVHKGLPCGSCHADEKALTGVHKNVDASSDLPKRLKKAKIDAAVCLACHGAVPETVEEGGHGLAADGVAIKDGGDAVMSAEVAMPMLSDDSASPWEALAELTDGSDVLVDSEGTVVNPHDLPTVSDHAAITCIDCHKVHAEADAAKTARSLCRTCHHEDVFECYTCHD